MATIAPATAVTRVNMAVMNPCRNPDTAAAITSNTTMTSTPVIAGSSRATGGCSSQVRQVEGPLAVPRPRPAAEFEQDVHQSGGEAPHHQVGDPEGRTDQATGVPQ